MDRHQIRIQTKFVFKKEMVDQDMEPGKIYTVYVRFAAPPNLPHTPVGNTFRMWLYLPAVLTDAIEQRCRPLVVIDVNFVSIATLPFWTCAGRGKSNIYGTKIDKYKSGISANERTTVTKQCLLKSTSGPAIKKTIWKPSKQGSRAALLEETTLNIHVSRL